MGRPVAAIGLFAAAFLVATPTSAERAPLRLVDPATSETVALAPSRGVTHLVFFAVWCRPCVDELGALGDFEARWGAGAYRLVLVAVPTRHDVPRLRAFAAEHAPPGRLLFDAKGDAVRSFGVDKLPTHVILDESGATVATAPQFDDSLRETIVAKVRAARGEPAR